MLSTRAWAAAVAVVLMTLLVPRASGVVIELSTNQTFDSRSAAFGPLVPEGGHSGILVPMRYFNASLEQACEPVLQDPPPLDNWIALVQRGGEDCYFIDKVRHMQALGASGVIVGDNNPNGGLLIMNSNGDVSDVVIPALFVTYDSYQSLVALGAPSPNTSVFATNVLMLREQFVVWPMLDIIIVTIIAPTVIMLLLYSLYRVRQRVRQRQEVVPPAVVINLPKKTFSREAYKEGDPDTCAICLEDFEDGAELRILPCKHEYHVTCIDPWLTMRKRFCPLCKSDAGAGGTSGAASAPTEDSPLVSRATSAATASASASAAALTALSSDPMPPTTVPAAASSAPSVSSSSSAASSSDEDSDDEPPNSAMRRRGSSRSEPTDGPSAPSSVASEHPLLDVAEDEAAHTSSAKAFADSAV